MLTKGITICAFTASEIGSDNDIGTIIATQLIQFNSVMSQLKISLKEMADETALLRQTMLSCQACGNDFVGSNMSQDDAFRCIISSYYNLLVSFFGKFDWLCRV